MATENKPRVDISIDAPLVPFGQIHIRITKPRNQARDMSGRRKTAPYSLPTSTGGDRRLVFRQGASGG